MSETITYGPFFLLFKEYRRTITKLPASVQFSRSVVSNSLRAHGLQHARLPCPSPTPRAYSNSCPWSWRCHPTISSSVIPFCSFLQSFPTSGSFLSQPYASGGQNVGASASVFPMNIQDWFPLGLTGLISLQPEELSSRRTEELPVTYYMMQLSAGEISASL